VIDFDASFQGTEGHFAAFSGNRGNQRLFKISRLDSASRTFWGEAMKVFLLLARVVVTLVAAPFVLGVLFAQATCSQFSWFGHQCVGSDGDVWMLPFLYSPIGIPATVIAIALFMIHL
jgi:hypothetical protein